MNLSSTSQFIPGSAPDLLSTGQCTDRVAEIDRCLIRTLRTIRAVENRISKGLKSSLGLTSLEKDHEDL